MERKKKRKEEERFRAEIVVVKNGFGGWGAVRCVGTVRNKKADGRAGWGVEVVCKSEFTERFL